MKFTISLNMKNKFRIKRTIEQLPFLSPVTRSFFSKWLEVNDSIEVNFLNRSDFEKMNEFLKEKSNGKYILFVPKDLKLWEMIGIIEEIDRLSFNKKLNGNKKSNDKLIKLAKIFQKTGVYIAKRLSKIKNGRNIAETLAVELYNYGKWLEAGKKIKNFSLDDILLEDITPEETEIIDRFLAGEKLYEERRKKIEKIISSDSLKNKEEIYEKERERTLSQFFRVAEIAFELEKKEIGGFERVGFYLKSWKDKKPFHQSFLNKIEEALKREIETPKRELLLTIFRRGLNKLLQETKEPPPKRGLIEILFKLSEFIGLDLKIKQNKLLEALNIPVLKSELEKLRMSGNKEEIGKREREIADLIQKAISSFNYEANFHNPSDIIMKQRINCVGSSMLGFVFLKELGIKCLVVTIPAHSALILISSDMKVEWRDMLVAPKYNKLLTNEIIEGYKENGESIKVKDIIEFSENPSGGVLKFKIREDWVEERYPWISEYPHYSNYCFCFEPEGGLYIQLLLNIAYILSKSKHYKESIEIYNNIIKFNSKVSYAYYNLGVLFCKFNLHQKEIELYKKAISIDSDFAIYYKALGDAFYEINNYKEAVDAYYKAISIAPTYSDVYYNLGNTLVKMGDYKEALIKYKKFLELEKDKSSFLVEQVNKIVKELEELIG